MEAESLSGEEWTDGVSLEPFGVVVVIPPWNFPCAIPCGGGSSNSWPRESTGGFRGPPPERSSTSVFAVAFGS